MSWVLHCINVEKLTVALMTGVTDCCLAGPQDCSIGGNSCMVL